MLINTPSSAILEMLASHLWLLTKDEVFFQPGMRRIEEPGDRNHASTEADYGMGGQDQATAEPI
jgi:hypothetical protein